MEDGTARGHGGRALDSSRDDALRQATLALLAEVGYERLTIDAVAARAHAGKATVYRRWASKADLVVDAVTHRDGHAPTPDTGSLRGDLLAMANKRPGGMDGFADTRLLAGLVTALLYDDDLRTSLQRAEGPSQLALDAVFARAAERGEIAPDIDLELVKSLLPALAFHRLIFHGVLPGPAFVETIVDEVILPLATTRR